MNHTDNNLILDKSQILQKIRRIAFQIYEDNFQEKEIIFAGIQGSGFALAKLLQKEFTETIHIPSRLWHISLDKMHPTQSDVLIDQEIQEAVNKTVIIVDDVLYTGRTLSYSLRPFLNIRVKKIRIVVLVDRQYRKFPVAADYVGYSLSTTLQEHIDVFLDENAKFGVFLS